MTEDENFTPDWVEAIDLTDYIDPGLCHCSAIVMDV
jgi:hypothetical protein